MKSSFKAGSVLLGLALLSGCATKAENVVASKVSIHRYESYTCEQLAREAERITLNAAALAGQQNQRARQDEAAMAATVLFAFPILLVQGDSPVTEKLAELKGSLEAVEIMSVQKNCNLAFRIS